MGIADNSGDPSSDNFMTYSTNVLIVGAGPAGLATAACLATHSIPFVILEREACTASLWKNLTYDCLHLHLPKEFCELPLFPFPSHYPTYPSRDQTVAYLDNYAEHFGIHPVFNTTVTSAEFSRQQGSWRVMADWNATRVCYTTKALVVATGENGESVMPLFRGQESFGGKTCHGKEYRNGKKYENQKVLVVGTGNTGMEIALDLAKFGAKPTLVARSPVILLEYSRIPIASLISTAIGGPHHSLWSWTSQCGFFLCFFNRRFVLVILLWSIKI